MIPSRIEEIEELFSALVEKAAASTPDEARVLYAEASRRFARLAKDGRYALYQNLLEGASLEFGEAAERLANLPVSPLSFDWCFPEAGDPL